MIASKGVARFIGESDVDTASSSANGMLLLDGALDGGDKEPARDVKDPEVAFTKRLLEYPCYMLCERAKTGKYWRSGVLTQDSSSSYSTPSRISSLIIKVYAISLTNSIQ